MQIEIKRNLSVSTKENGEVREQIHQEVNKLLNISEERKKAVADFLFWIIAPNNFQSPPEKIAKTRELVFSDAKLELAVNFVGSRLALHSETFTDIFKGTIIPSPTLPPERTVRRVWRLHKKGRSADQIASQTPLSLIEVYDLIRKLGKMGQVLPRSEQFGYAQINELDLSIAIDWLRGVSKQQILENYNLKKGRLLGITTKLIELGLIKRRRLALTQREKKKLDEKVANLSNQGNSRSKIASLLKATEGIIHSSLRRLEKEGRIKRKHDRFAEKDWQELAEKVILLRTKRLTWVKIVQQLKISPYRCREVSKRLRTKPSQNN